MTQNKILVGLGALLFISMMCFFTVNETEKAIKFRLGEIVKNDYEPGLHFKWPLINNVKKFDKRIQTMDAKPERFLTAEKKNVIVDS
ncbi:MAG: SPFH domain-containing protein, partial [Methylobacter sp.]